MRALVLLPLAALLLCSTAVAGTPAVKATLTAETTRPVVDEPWRWTVVVKDADGKPLRAKMKLQILFGTLVVGCWKRTAITQCTGTSPGTWIAFRGKRTGTLTWPQASVGQKLTFRALVVAGGRTLRLRVPVTIQART
jgi:hypothetical protein